MIKQYAMVASSIGLTVSFVYLIYRFGALFNRGEAKGFFVALGILGVFVVTQLAIAIWNES
ncbi:hypothetical protein FJY94_00755 [Candidatus Kaiserbacteria bacterium]|nr:hypothetical protein [Candidatus Kaiserbacteria bacterium]